MMENLKRTVESQRQTNAIVATTDSTTFVCKIIEKKIQKWSNSYFSYIEKQMVNYFMDANVWKHVIKQ